MFADDIPSAGEVVVVYAKVKFPIGGFMVEFSLANPIAMAKGGV